MYYMKNLNIEDNELEIYSTGELDYMNAFLKES